MTKQKVLLLGATGETGNSILEGLLAQPSQFDVEALVRQTSVEKPETKKLAERGVKIRVADLNGTVEELIPVVDGVDVLISAISAFGLLSQKNLVTASKKAGVKRFLPCMYGTITPPGGIMEMRDKKEEIIQHIRKEFLGYTIVDVGWWHQFAFPSAPSGKLDYATLMKRDKLHGDGSTPNLYTDLRDIGRFVARIVADERTLNKFVYTWGDELTENEIWDITEGLTGEKIERQYESHEETTGAIAALKAAAAAHPDDPAHLLRLIATQYDYAKFVRGYNSRAYAKYLGYLDARELYSDFAPIAFRDCLAEVVAGKASRPYQSGSTTTGKVISAVMGEGGVEANKALLESVVKEIKGSQ